MFKLLLMLFVTSFAPLVSAAINSYEILQLKDHCHIDEITQQNEEKLNIRELRSLSRDLGDFLKVEQITNKFVEVSYRNALNVELSKKIYTSNKRESDALAKKLKVDEWFSTDHENAFILFANNSCKTQITNLILYTNPTDHDFYFDELNSNTDFDELNLDANGEIIEPLGPAEGLLVNPKFPGTNISFFLLEEILPSGTIRILHRYNSQATLKQICYIHGYDSYVQNSVLWEEAEGEPFGIAYNTDRFINRNYTMRPEIFRTTSTVKALQLRGSTSKIFTRKKVKSLSCKINEKSKGLKPRLIGKQISGKVETEQYWESFRRKTRTTYFPIIIDYDDIQNGLSPYPLLFDSSSSESCNFFGYPYSMKGGMRYNLNSQTVVTGVLIDGDGYQSLKRGRAVYDLFCYKENA